LSSICQTKILSVVLIVVLYCNPDASTTAGNGDVWNVLFIVFCDLFWVIYDVVNEFPVMRIKQDEMTGAQKPIAIMQSRLNGQYIIEGLAAGAMLARGSVGYITLNLAVDSGLSERNRNLTILFGLLCAVASYLIIGMFLRMKVDKYSF